MTTTERNLLTLAGADTGRLVFNETTGTLQLWDGSAWIDVTTSDTVITDAMLPDPLSGGTY
ncbi:MAG: hypothetical protein ACO23G_10760 [Limnohabitans sp.]